MRLPRTLHIEDSRMPNGEVDPEAVKISSLIDKFVIVEEKIDGTGVSLSFDNNANISIQTRAHDAKAKQFARLHTWANENINKLWDLLNDRYVMYGEWAYAKHTIFYNNLCDYFLESDIYDKSTEKWLSTNKRQELLLAYTPNLICSVPVLKIGRVQSLDELKSHIGQSFFKTDKWRNQLNFYCNKYHYDFDKVLKETDVSMFMEGLYIKHEDKDCVLGRFKYVRYEFLQTILKSGSHYSDRATIPNILGEFD